MVTTAHSGDERVARMVFRRIRVTCSSIEVGLLGTEATSEPYSVLLRNLFAIVLFFRNLVHRDLLARGRIWGLASLVIFHSLGQLGIDAVL